MLKLISEGYKFTNEDFTGGTKPSELSCPPRERIRLNAKAARALKLRMNMNCRPMPVVGEDGGRMLMRDEGDPSLEAGANASELRKLMDDMFNEQEAKLEAKLSEILAAKMAENNATKNVVIMEGITKWFNANFVVSEQATANMPQPTSRPSTRLLTNIN